MKQSVYLETSIISYLASRPSRDLIVAANQQLTLEWWETRAGDFDLFVSDIVYDECSAGDTDAAERRVSIIQMITSLSIDQRVDNLVISLLKQRVLPQKAWRDATHIAVAAVYRMDYLLTWNCKHIANAEIRDRLERIGYNMGYKIPIICTPLQLMRG